LALSQPSKTLETGGEGKGGRGDYFHFTGKETEAQNINDQLMVTLHVSGRGRTNVRFLLSSP
jgi:hypothetical protein